MDEEKKFVGDCQTCPMPCFDYEETGYCWQMDDICPEFEPWPVDDHDGDKDNP